MSVCETCTCTNLENEEPVKTLEQHIDTATLDAPTVEIVDTSKRNGKKGESVEIEVSTGQRLHKRRDSNDKALLMVEKKTEDINKMRRSSFSKEEDKGNETNLGVRIPNHNALKVEEKSNNHNKIPLSTSNNKITKTVRSEEKNKKITATQRTDIEEEDKAVEEERLPISINAEVKLLRWKAASEAYENKLWQLVQNYENKIAEG